MGCKVGRSSDEQTAHLLLITMHMIGLPVDVHVKDGSLYTGIFYTASAHKNYAIVLKKAMMTKKGSRDVNIEKGSLMDTLIVQGEDLVQVVAKGVNITENGIFGGEATLGKLKQSNVDKQHANLTRLAGDGLDVEHGVDEKKTEDQGPEIVDSLHVSSSDKAKYKVMPVDVPSHAPIPASARLGDQSFEKRASEKSPFVNDILDISTDSSSLLHAAHSTSSRSGKDSKLNPQAKVFTPTLYRHVLVAIPGEVPNMGYFVDPSVMATTDVTQLAYNDSIQPVYDVTGYTGDKTQAVAFASPYHFDAASAYVHQNLQNIMAGQMRPPVYLPPLAHEAITASAVSQLSLSPMLTHYQVHIPGHQVERIGVYIILHSQI